MGDTLRSSLPILYAPLLPDLFDRPAPSEARATCSDCAMCDKSGKSPPPGTRVSSFHPDLKCCTYHPTLPNYLVGAILADPRPELAEGKKRIREQIAARFGATPEWLSPRRKYRVLLEAARESSFGRSPALRCPYLDAGRCSIWQHREAVCATFFCKHAFGARGHAFWTAVKSYLTYAEVVLARWAVSTIDPELREPDQPRLSLTIEDLDDRPPRDDDYRSWWRAFAGREEELYVTCHERVRGLGRDDVARLVDETPRGRELLAAIAARHDEVFSPRPATHLVLNPEMKVVPLEDGGVAVTTYSRYDTLVLGKDLYEVLRLFDPREPLDVTLDRLAREKELDVPAEVIAELRMHDVVVAPDRPGDIPDK